MGGFFKVRFYTSSGYSKPRQLSHFDLSLKISEVRHKYRLSVDCIIRIGK